MRVRERRGAVEILCAIAATNVSVVYLASDSLRWDVLLPSFWFCPDLLAVSGSTPSHKVCLPFTHP